MTKQVRRKKGASNEDKSQKLHHLNDSGQIDELMSSISSIPIVLDKVLENINHIFYFRAFPKRRLEIRGNDFDNEKDSEFQLFFQNYQKLSINELVVKWLAIDSKRLSLFLEFFIANSKSLEKIRFENCYFFNDLWNKFSDFKFEFLRSFEIKESSINEKTLNHLISILPRSLTNLELCANSWENGKNSLIGILDTFRQLD